MYSPFLQKLINQMLNKIPENRIKIAEILELEEIQNQVFRISCLFNIGLSSNC